jgi:hypothetical protein
MSIQLARSILSASDSDARLSLIFAAEEAMVWNEYGDEVEQFNRIIAQYPGIPQASVDSDDAEVRMTYKDTTVNVPLEYDRQDNLRAVLALAGLTHDDLAFRMCVDTDGHSEFAFFVLPPAQWVALDNEFGIETVGKCFLAACDSCDALYDALAGPETPLSPWEQAAHDCAARVEEIASLEAFCSVSYSLGDDNHLVLLVDTETDNERDLLFHSAAWRSALDAYEPALRKDGLVLEHVRLESQETIERDWGGIGFEILYRVMSPKLWFNRQSGPTDEEKRNAHKLLQTLND